MTGPGQDVEDWSPPSYGDGSERRDIVDRLVAEGSKLSAEAANEIMRLRAQAEIVHEIFGVREAGSSFRDLKLRIENGTPV